MKTKSGDAILKIMVIVFSLIVLGNSIEYFFVNKSNLKKINGRVSEVILETYECPGFKYSKATCEKTIIKLEKVMGSFNVSDKLGRGAYIDVIEKGDEVTIYARKWYQYFFTFGTGNSIYGIEKGGVSYYDIDRWKASNKVFMLIFGILSLFFGGLYILQRVTINKMMKGKTV